MDGLAAPGVNLPYAREDHIHPTDTSRASTTYVDTKDALAVRYDSAQGLTAPQQTQARQNVYAAPFDALAYSGMQINGSMDVSQENGVSATTVNGKYIVDGWKLFSKAGTMPLLTRLRLQLIRVFPGFATLISLAVRDFGTVANCPQ